MPIPSIPHSSLTLLYIYRPSSPVFSSALPTLLLLLLLLPFIAHTTLPTYTSLNFYFGLNQLYPFAVITSKWLIQAQPLPGECGVPFLKECSCMWPCWPCSLAMLASMQSQGLPLTWVSASLFSQSIVTSLPCFYSFPLPTSWKSQ